MTQQDSPTGATLPQGAPTGALGPLGAPVDSAAARHPDRTILKGRIVTLRSLVPEVDADPLWESAGGAGKAHLWAYLFDGPFADRPAFDANLASKAASQDPLYLAIVDRQAGRAAGHAAYMRIEPVHRTIEVGSILYGEALQRTAGATEAMYLMARHVFEDLGYRRYEWKCDALNAPSRRAALRLGFRFEGIFRQHLIVKGRSRDTAWYSMLDAEWPRRKAAFERWLDPANFDAAGRQRLSLSSLVDP